MNSELDVILEINNLTINFGDTTAIQALDFDLIKGQTLGIVGESGSGKSLTSYAIMGLLPKTAKVSHDSEIKFKSNGTFINLLNLTEKEKKGFRGNNIGMIFQEPMTSLNPSMRCGQQVQEVIELHLGKPKKEAKKKVLRLFEKVLLPNPERIYKAYPHELSGGQKQRVMIAMAISCEPKLLIADEPTTALDVTVQQSILELLKKLQQEEGMSMIFISHDLGVIAQVSDEVLVMYRGEKVEHGSIEEIFNRPKENYTKGLIACRPKLNVRYKKLPTVTDFLENPDHKAPIYTSVERELFHHQMYQKKPILEIKNLKKYFYNQGLFGGKEVSVKAVNDVNFKVYPGETLGLVGESGSGKTTLSRTLLLLEKPTEGNVFFNGRDITKLSKSEVRLLRKDIQIIFQDPYSSLNPRSTIQQILLAPMKVHRVGISKKERLSIAKDLLIRVGLQASDLNKYPHEFSGGQRQRIGIARALTLKPKFIICDESVSALDVSIQAQVLNLLNELKHEFGFTYIFISHDLSVVKYMSDQLVVLRHGKIFENADADEVYQNPKTEYTRELIDAIPKL